MTHFSDATAIIFFTQTFRVFLSLPFVSTKYEYPIRIIQMQTTLCKSKIVIQ